MSTPVEVERLVSSVMLRVIRMKERAQAVEASLRGKAEAGVEHPELPQLLAAAHAAVEDCEQLLGRLAASALRCEKMAANSLSN